MRWHLLLLILVSVLLSSGSQVLLKYGMTSTSIRDAMAGRGDAWQLALAIGQSPLVLAGLACFGLSAVVWLFVLARVPLSSAYPFVALGIVIAVLAGRLLFNEQLGLTKLLGVTLILAGIGAVAVSMRQG